MSLQPISNPYSPLCFVQCAKCNTRCSTAQAAADVDGEAFKTYYCWGCQPQDVRDAVEKASSAAFQALSPGGKHYARVQLFGKQQTREIEEREQHRRNQS